MRFRGIDDLEAYINPPDNYLQSATNLKNIQAAAALYLRVVMQPQARILLVVDSDCDGYTSGAIMYQYTKQVNCHCQIDYILHEHKEHGLQDHIKRLIESNIHYDLVILPDSSSNDYEYHEQLKILKTSCLCLDHHEAEGPFSDNVIIVNNQLSPKYSCKGTVGAGITWQFCRHMDSILHSNWAKNYLDLVALATVGDMGNILEEDNRWFVVNGFSEKHIKNSLLIELLNKQAYSITGKVSPSWKEIVSATTPMSVAYYIVPLINALIRVGTMEQKDRMFRAFLGGEEKIESQKRGAKGELVPISVEVVRECINAKNAQNRAKEISGDSIEIRVHKYDLLANKILVFLLEDEDDYPPELNGLLAMNLAAKFKKPTLILRPDKDGKYARGSGRGLSQSALTDFRGFLQESGLFEYVQGHAQAFGCAISINKIDDLIKYANQELASTEFSENCYEINFERDCTDIDLRALILDLCRAQKTWGQENPVPLIYITNIPFNSTTLQIMGKNQNNLKLEYNGIPFIKFQATKMIEELPEKNCGKLTIVGKPNLNEWGGRVTPQIFIEDYEFVQ